MSELRRQVSPRMQKRSVDDSSQTNKYVAWLVILVIAIVVAATGLVAQGARANSLAADIEHLEAEVDSLTYELSEAEAYGVQLEQDLDELVTYASSLEDEVSECRDTIDTAVMYFADGHFNDGYYELVWSGCSR